MPSFPHWTFANILVLNYCKLHIIVELAYSCVSNKSTGTHEKITHNPSVVLCGTMRHNSTFWSTVLLFQPPYNSLLHWFCSRVPNKNGFKGAVIFAGSTTQICC